MFTGIVQCIGEIGAVERRGEDLTLLVRPGALELSRLRVGDSLAVNGVCLTATSVVARDVRVDVSAATLSRTLLATFEPGRKVNLELAVTAATPMGGHFVAGHVDGVASVTGRRDAGRSVQMTFAASMNLARYVAAQGAVCIDGVSLTVNAVRDTEHDVTFDVNIVPHTLQATTLRDYAVGQRVHIEVDMIARHLERLLAPLRGAPLT